MTLLAELNKKGPTSTAWSKWLAELSIRRPVSTIMLFVSLVVVGLIAAVRLPLESMPEATAPFLFVQLPYAGSTPEEVERNVLRPAEEALGTMSGIKSIRGRANADGAQLFVVFTDWGRDVAIAAADARQRLDASRDQLPDDFQRYFIWKWSTSDQSAMTIRLTSKAGDLRTQSDRIDREFKSQLERLPGVARVEVDGVPVQEVEIALHPDRLTAAGVALNELVNRMQSANFAVSAGEIEDGGMRLRVQPIGELRDLQQLRDMPINSKGIRLGDIADVALKPKRMDYARIIDGRPSVAIDVYKERTANLVDLSKVVRAKLDEIKASGNTRGIDTEIVDDAGQGVISSLTALAEAGAIGLVLSIAVLFFFLRHWPSTLMVTLAIPICFIMTLGFMYFAGVTLNVLSMMGLLLAIGMLVDNAVVVVESIYQERERHPDNPRYASIIGTRHVAIALTAGTLCHCIVFLPNMFGERNMLTINLAQIAITITVSLLASWLVAVSLIPMLSARLKTPPAVASHNGIIPRLQSRYAKFLRWTLEHRGASVAGILLVIAISIVPMILTKKSMMDAQDPDRVDIFYQWNGAYTKDQMGEEIAKVERYVNANRQRFHVKQLNSRWGEQGWARTTIRLDTKDPKQVAQVEEDVRKGMPKSARARIGIGDQQQDTGQQGVSVNLLGDSSQALKDLANDLLPALSRQHELRDVRVDSGDQDSELTISVDRARAAAYGFSSSDVAKYVGMALRGSNLREFQRDQKQIPVTVRFAGAEQSRIEDLQGFMVQAPDGRQIPLMAMVNAQVKPSANQIQRSDRQTSLKIQANVAPGSTGEQAQAAIERVLKGTSFPPGYRYSFKGGGMGNMDGGEMMSQMLFNLLIAVLMIYIVMAAVFESLLFPAAIMSGVVFSIFGVFWAMFLTGTTFNIMAFIGILVLMGVVVNNGIVMIEHINNRRRAGMSRTDALVEGSKERLRPILMTMGTAILAMVPIAVSNTQIAGDGPPYNPMARAIAGGLAFSTLVSLLFLPTIYAILDDWRAATAQTWRRARLWRRGGASVEVI
ncbi:MAG: efflux RND transporter permease subunit [Proteobacteria bacterium]|nr:efflux RND transporter permease subunit [Pseudomonadota bacterium]